MPKQGEFDNLIKFLREETHVRADQDNLIVGRCLGVRYRLFRDEGWCGVFLPGDSRKAHEVKDVATFIDRVAWCLGYSEDAEMMSKKDDPETESTWTRPPSPTMLRGPR